MRTSRQPTETHHGGRRRRRRPGRLWRRCLPQRASTGAPLGRDGPGGSQHGACPCRHGPRAGRQDRAGALVSTCMQDRAGALVSTCMQDRAGALVSTCRQDRAGACAAAAAGVCPVWGAGAAQLLAQLMEIQLRWMGAEMRWVGAELRLMGVRLRLMGAELRLMEIHRRRIGVRLRLMRVQARCTRSAHLGASLGCARHGAKLWAPQVRLYGSGQQKCGHRGQIRNRAQIRSRAQMRSRAQIRSHDQIRNSAQTRSRF